MVAMMGNPQYRSRLGVDNPIDGDGFYRYWRKRGTFSGRPTTGRFRRRAIRAKETTAWKREARVV